MLMLTMPREFALTGPANSEGDYSEAGLFSNNECRTKSDHFQGPPGTGKTHTMTEIVDRYLRSNKTSKILCCASSNDAADHMALKCYELGNGKYDVVRVQSQKNAANAGTLIGGLALDNRIKSMLHRGMKMGSKAKADAQFVDATGGGFRGRIDFYAQNRKDIRAAAFAGDAAVAVLGDGCARGCGNDRGGGADVEGSAAISAGSAGVDECAAGGGKLDHGGAKRFRCACDFGGGFAFLA